MMFLFVLISLAILQVLDAGEASLHLKWIDSKIDGLAVCNDGSPTAFHFASAIDPNFQDTFLIYLPGGGQCYDYDSCTSRWKTSGSTYMSSKSYPNVTLRGGIFETDPSKSPLWGANKIILGYCSSDGYMGDAGASEKTWGWHFRGARIVITLIKDLIANYGLSERSTIIMSGGSAGARGTMTLIDLLVRDYFPKGSKVIGFLDSPYYLDLPPYSPAFQGFPYQEQSKYQYFNTSLVSYGECASVYPSEEERWKCQFGEYRVPLLTSPYLLIASQFDSYQLSNNLQTNPPYQSEEEVNYAVEFGQRTASLVTNLSQEEVYEGGRVKGYLSWACYNHDVSESDGFWKVKTSTGVSQNLALQQYLALNPFITVGEEKQGEAHRLRGGGGRNQMRSDINSGMSGGGSNLLWIDSCSGFNCGTGC